MKLLGGLNAEQFIARYWQKKPYLIRQALTDYSCPFTAEALAGLALEENVESRLIIQDKIKDTWIVKNGPFKEQEFCNLPESHWTLLIQAVERHIPYIADFMDCFAFIPNWRRDDVMISFAQDHGSVGPHVDSYDVFLFQASGKRQWSINEKEYSEADSMENHALRLIPNFKPCETWLLEPGDMLYLPPGVAHHGIAQGDCITFSIGFRAPSQIELLNDFCDQASLHQFPSKRYSDPNLTYQQYSGEIQDTSLETLYQFMQQQLSDRKQFNHWFANYSSCSDYQPEQTWPLEKSAFLAACKQYDLVREGAVRALFIEEDNSIQFYLNGDRHTLPMTMKTTVAALCQCHRVDFENIESLSHSQALELLYQLYQCGYYFFDE